MAIKTMYNLCGEQGAKGDDGITPHIGFNGNWFIGETDTGVKAQGPRGIQGFQGIQGEQGGQGVKGENGTSFRICDTNFTAHTTEDIDSFATFNYQESFDKSGIIGFGDTKVGDTIGLLIPNSDTSKDSVYLGLVSEILENSIVCLGRGLYTLELTVQQVL